MHRMRARRDESEEQCSEKKNLQDRSGRSCTEGFGKKWFDALIPLAFED